MFLVHLRDGNQCFLCTSETRVINMSRADRMSRADSRMMLVFGGFASKPETLTFEESLRFVKKVKVLWIGVSKLHDYLLCLLTSHGLAAAEFVVPDLMYINYLIFCASKCSILWMGLPQFAEFRMNRTLTLWDMNEFQWPWDYLNCYVIAISKLNC
jgi:hypothetical protein